MANIRPRSGGQRFSPLTQINRRMSANYRSRGSTTCGLRCRLRHLPPSKPAAARLGRGGGRGAAARARPRAWPRRLRLRGGADDAARRRRRHVHHDAVRPRCRARSDDRQGSLGLSNAEQRADVERRQCATGRCEDAAPDRVRQRQWPLFPARKNGEPNEAFGEKGVVNLNTPENLRGLPGNNALGSPPTMCQHLIITGGRTQENPPKGPAGDVRAWDIHTGNAGVDVPLDSAGGREVQRHVGR